MMLESIVERVLYAVGGTLMGAALRFRPGAWGLS
jgi:hypothetical protein